MPCVKKTMFLFQIGRDAGRAPGQLQGGGPETPPRTHAEGELPPRTPARRGHGAPPRHVFGCGGGGEVLRPQLGALLPGLRPLLQRVHKICNPSFPRSEGYSPDSNKYCQSYYLISDSRNFLYGRYIFLLWGIGHKWDD